MNNQQVMEFLFAKLPWFQEGSVREKTYGKQKVYVFNQDQFPPLDETQLQEMDRQVAELTTSLREKERQLSEAEAQLRTLTATPTTQEAQDRAVKVNKLCLLLFGVCHEHYYHDYDDIIVTE